MAVNPNEIFKLFGAIEVDERGANRQLTNVDKKAESVSRSMSNSFEKVASTFDHVTKSIERAGTQMSSFGRKLSRTAGIPLAGLTAAFGKLSQATIAYGDDMAKQAQEVGMAVEAYQELNFAMGQNGVKAEEARRALGNLNSRIGDARRGNESYRDSLQELGVDMDALQQGTLQTDEVFMQIIGSLHDMQDSQMQVSAANEMFGERVARKLLPAIRQGEEGFFNLRRQAQEYGFVMDSEATRRSEQAGDAMDLLSRTIGGLTRAIGVQLLPPIINVAEAITEVVQNMSAWIQDNPVLVRRIIMVGGAVAGLLTALVTLGTVFFLTGKAIVGLSVIMGLLFSKPMLIIAAMGLLYAAWQSDWLGIRTTLTNVWDKYLNPILTRLWNWLGEKWEFAINIAGDAWRWFRDTTWEQKWQDIKGWMEDGWDWLIDTEGGAWAWFKDTFLDQWLEDLSDLITDSELWNWAIDTVGTAWDWFEGTALMDWLRDISAKITDSDAWKWAVDIALPRVMETGEMVVSATMELAGDLWRAFQKGIETGEWGDFWQVAADVWQKGIIVAITLSSAIQGAGMALAGIKTALGLIAATGISGVLGALTIALEFERARSMGEYRNFAGDLVGALLMGFAAVGILGSIKAGALVFTVTLSLRLGSQFIDAAQALGNWVEEMRSELLGEEYTATGLGDSIFRNLSKFLWGEDEEETEERLERIKEDGITFDELIEDMTGVARETEIANVRVRESLEDVADEAESAAQTFEQLNTDMSKVIADVLGEGRYTTTRAILNERTGSAEEFVWRLGMSESSMNPNASPGTSSARGEWQLLNYAQGEVEKLLGAIDWDDPVERTRAAVEWLRIGVEDEFHYIQGAVERLGISFDEAVKAWWVMGGPDLDRATLDTPATMNKSLGEILGIFQGYRSGGYTGNAPPHKAVGLVHGMETVIPEPAHRKGFAGMVQWLADYMGVSGFQEGGSPAGLWGRTTAIFGGLRDMLPPGAQEVFDKAISFLSEWTDKIEEALWALEEFAGATSESGEASKVAAKGFMESLKKAVESVDVTVEDIGAALGRAAQDVINFGKTLRAGDYKGALLQVFAQSESFARIMEILGNALKPVVALLDGVLLPIINAITWLWNGILNALASISIFGWKPFGGLAKHTIDTDGDSGGGGGSGSGGARITEITGPTRDLLTDLLRPLANFGTITGIGERIYNILDARLPNFNDEFAAVGMGGITIQNLNVTAPTGGIDAVAKATIGELERAMAEQAKRRIRGTTDRTLNTIGRSR